MIPKDVADIASLIDPNWTQGDDLNLNYVLEAAWRIYNAGYRRVDEMVVGRDCTRHTVHKGQAMTNRPFEDVKAGDSFRSTLVTRADLSDRSGAPLWYGWALMDAFLAGIDYERKRTHGQSTPEK